MNLITAYSRMLLINLLLILSFFTSETCALNLPLNDYQNTHILLEYSYGNHYLLPSLEYNSSFIYANSESYTDIWARMRHSLSENIYYSGSVELTNLHHTLIGTKYSRPDYALSTGRFQESQIQVNGNSYHVQIGRTNFFNSAFTSNILSKPISGDGIAWSFSHNSWSFKHVIATLPSEKFGEVVYRRLINYHHIQREWGLVNFGLGEYFLLTGTSLGIDFKRLNPFIPYARNSHDSYENTYAGFDGDSDNSLIRVFLTWANLASSIRFNLYIDELQIDSKDRDRLNDAILLHLGFVRKFDSQSFLCIPWSFEASLSLCDPNFGQHPGPFTTATSAGYPLFEHSPGMTSMIHVNAKLNLNEVNQLSVEIFREKWVAISSLSPLDRNMRSALIQLDVMEDSRLALDYVFKLKGIHTSVRLTSWYVIGENNIIGGKLSLFHNIGY
jgi:hypothetical protein